MIKFDKDTIIEKFKSSDWVERAQACLKSPEKLSNLSDSLSVYMNKDGLKNVRNQLAQLVDYLRFLLVKGYHDYKDNTLVVIIAVAIYVVSPIDLIPDFLPGGFKDDEYLIAWLFQTLGNKLEAASQQLDQEKKLLDAEL